MIRDKLLVLLKQKFGAGAFIEGVPPVAIFPAMHPMVGDMRLFDVKNEGRIEIEHITHGHFYSFLEGASPDENEQEVAETMAEFVEDVFAGRYVFWLSKNGGCGGWEYRESVFDRIEPPIQGEVELFLWSGPMQADKQSPMIK